MGFVFTPRIDPVTSLSVDPSLDSRSMKPSQVYNACSLVHRRTQAQSLVFLYHL